MGADLKILRENYLDSFRSIKQNMGEILGHFVTRDIDQLPKAGTLKWDAAQELKLCYHNTGM